MANKLRVEYSRPVVGVSDCLEFKACRYDGARVHFDLVRNLEPHVEYRTVCPELGIGLGVPRDPIRVVNTDGALRLLQPATGRDLTKDMKDFAARFLEALGTLDGFILKSRSPSCGTGDVKVYPGAWSRTPSETGSGFFAAAVLKRHPDLPVEDEARLDDHGVREHFLTRIFALARLRDVVQSGQIAQLVRFHASYKFLLLAYSETGMRELGWVAANPDKEPPADVIARYAEAFRQALASPPRRSAFVNVFEHIYGFLVKQLDIEARRKFADQLARFRHDRIPASDIATQLESWAVSLGSSYILDQAVFAPFPRELAQARRPRSGRFGNW